MQIDPAYILLETEHWQLNHHLASKLPGYLMLGAKARIHLQVLVFIYRRESLTLAIRNGTSNITPQFQGFLYIWRKPTTFKTMGAGRGYR